MPSAVAVALSLLVSASSASSTPATLSFDRLYELRHDRLELRDEVKALAGKRVRIVGFMAKMEVPPQGAFYLVPRPLVADESGAGSADLPPTAIRVVVRSAGDRALEPVKGPIAVTGVLDIGRREEPDQLPSFLRIALDRPPKSSSKNSKVN